MASILKPFIALYAAILLVAMSLGLLDIPYGFFIYFSDASAIYAAVSFALRQTEMAPIIPVEEQVDFMIMNDTSQMAIRIDPRSEVDEID
jgi:hypothetical protein